MTENWYQTWGWSDFKNLTGSDIFRCFFDRKWDVNACDEHHVSVR